MGQSVSKSVSSVRQRISGKSTANGVRGGRPPQTPGPDASSAFSQGATLGNQFVTPKDAHQQQFLRKTKGEYKDMNPELQKFLQDIGPLQKKTVASSSDKQTLRTEDEKSRPRREPRVPRELRTNDRTVANMPLAKNVPGFETSRTSSFSHSAPQQDVSEWNHGDILEIYRLVSMKQEGVIAREGPDWDATLAGKFFDEFATFEQKKEWSNNIQMNHKQMIRSTLWYLDIPVLMQDPEDESWIGVHPEQKTELQERHKLVTVPSDAAKLVLQDLAELEMHKKK